MSEHLSEEEKTRRAYILARIDENNIRPITGITICLTKITQDQTPTRDSRLSRAQRPQTAGHICRQSASQILFSAYQANEVPHLTYRVPPDPQSVRITVICHDTRLSGFGLEDRMSDQKSKQELKIKYRSRLAHS